MCDIIIVSIIASMNNSYHLFKIIIITKIHIYMYNYILKWYGKSFTYIHMIVYLHYYQKNAWKSHSNFSLCNIWCFHWLINSSFNCKFRLNSIEFNNVIIKIKTNINLALALFVFSFPLLVSVSLSTSGTPKDKKCRGRFHWSWTRNSCLINWLLHSMYNQIVVLSRQLCDSKLS